MARASRWLESGDALSRRTALQPIAAPAVQHWFAIGFTGLAVFAAIELWVARDPLLDLHLFRHGVFVVASGIGYVTVVALFGAEFLMPVYLQALRGYSALATGVRLLPMAVMAGCGLPMAGRLYDRIGPRPLLLTGFALLAFNTWQLAELTAETPIAWIMVLLASRGLAPASEIAWSCLAIDTRTDLSGPDTAPATCASARPTPRPMDAKLRVALEEWSGQPAAGSRAAFEPAVPGLS